MLLLVILVTGGIIWLLVARHRSEQAADKAFEQELQQAEQPAQATGGIEPSSALSEGTSAQSAAVPRPTPPPPPKYAANQPDPGPELIQNAEKRYAEKDLPGTREVCFEILDASANPAARARAEALLGEVNTSLVFAPYPMEEKVDYTVSRGDTLAVLAKKYKTTVELIQKGNNLRGSLIRLGDRFRILNGTFSMVVDKNDNDLVLYLNDRFFKRYRVGTGEFARTPEGEFQITDRVAQPTWWRPDGKRVPYGDPENLLGTHWLSLNIRGYGLHGTWEPESVGKQSSAGCVRMLNEDIEEIYTLVPVGTTVTIK
ncbi:MAG: L,D-transpeptidase family protein [Kiritimatiellae bacterium]|nr:L,D-transpeptidase family protein [Kiritimatiellia bacterium]